MKKIIGVLIVIPMFFVDAKQTRKMEDVEELLRRSAAQQPIPAVKIDQAALIKRLDEQLRLPVESAWDDRINDLFDLAMVDRELARQYFVKMRDAMAVTDVKPVEVVVEKKAAEKKEEATKIKPVKGVEEKPKSKPEAKKAEITSVEKKLTELPAGEKSTEIGPKHETTEGIATGKESVTEGSMPVSRKPAPSRLPAKKIGGAVKPGSVTKKSEKKLEVAKPGIVLTGEESFGSKQLEKMENEELINLFNEYLEKLPRYWNSTITEAATKLWGTPNDRWKNNVATVKKVIISKGLMPEAEMTQKIADRIVQVRKEKSVKPTEAVQPEEKPKEAITEDELVKEIEDQLAKKTLTTPEFAAIKSKIRTLGGFNKEKAAEYDAELKRRMKQQ